MSEKEFICINCPMGCRLRVQLDGGNITVSGNACKRGEAYGKQEAVEPKRILTCLMRASNRTRPFSVKTSVPVPKEALFRCANAIYETRPAAPLDMGEVVIRDLCGTGADVVATQDLL